MGEKSVVMYSSAGTLCFIFTGYINITYSSPYSNSWRHWKWKHLVCCPRSIYVWVYLRYLYLVVPLIFDMWLDKGWNTLQKSAHFIQTILFFQLLPLEVATATHLAPAHSIHSTLSYQPTQEEHSNSQQSQQTETQQPLTVKNATEVAAFSELTYHIHLN